ncbi:DNA-directed DNA polymerase alpha subunit POL12 PWA37_003805 [Arxiozyma heterogenica]|uniref:DNA-directed DNA polymerase alpha subunit POL12 n=1 Tax=Arxiozyma heterogenica TaxID=278026 RepID=UPI002F112F72
MTTNDELIQYFGPEVSKPEITSALNNLLRLYAITVEELFIKWEQFSQNERHENQTALTVANIDQFKKFLQAKIEKYANSVGDRSFNGGLNNDSVSSSINKKIRPVRVPNSSNGSMFGFSLQKSPMVTKKRKVEVKIEHDKSSQLDFKSEGDNSFNYDTEVKSESSVQLSSTPSTPFMSNSKSSNVVSGSILDSLNPQNMEISQGLLIPGENPKQHIKIQPYYDPSKYKFRTMRQKLVDVSDVLDEQIEIATKLIQDHYKISPTSFGDPTIQSQNEVYAVGRIVPDSPTADGFLNIQSLSLETSRIGGVGRRIRLNFDNIEEVSLFAGQLVAFKGKNANGDLFSVKEVLNLPYPDAPVSIEEDIINYKELLDNNSSKIVITSGPYIAENSFDLSHLINFVERINTDVRPHVLIMFGPFIDVTNAMVMNGTIPEFPELKNQPRTLDELFTKLIVPILKMIDPAIQVILIPSTRDVISNHASYPQDSFDRKSLQLPKNFKCFTNPSTFQLNEIYFGCSNVDIFKDMKEIIKGGNTSMRNRFDRIAEHILQQRRFYPLFPGAIRKITIPSEDRKVYRHISGADLEVSYLGLTEFVGNTAPDVVIIPSEMNPFARIIKNVLFINPGRFIKARGAKGTYAQISTSCPSTEGDSLTRLDGDEMLYLHNAWKRSRVDIVTS